MKKFSIYFLLIISLLFTCAIPARAAGNASLSGPATLRAGDTITVTFTAGGGISGGSGTISYDANQLTLQSKSQTIAAPYVVQFNGNNFVFYDDAMQSPISGSKSIFQMTFSVKSDLAVDTNVSVKITNLVLSDGNTDQAIGTVSYSKTVAQPLSDNCNLKSMTVTGASISPAFSPSVTSYSASVPFTTEKISVSAVAEHEKAKVSVSNPTLTPGGTTTVQVTVTAEKGNTKVYKIAVTRAQDPNYVPSGNAQLQSLAVENFTLSPAFDPAVTQYYVWLPYETENISLSAQAADAKAKYEIGTFQLLPGIRADIPVTVTAEDGTQQVYTVTAVRAPEHDKTEDYLNGDREPVPEPTEPEVLPTEETAPETTKPMVVQIPAETKAPSYYIFYLCVAIILSAAAGAVLTLLICKRRNGF